MNALEKTGGTSLAANDATKVPAIEEFVKRLHEWPEQNEVKVNEKANNSFYLPISFVQTKLDEFYMGLWQTRNFTTKVVANEIIGELGLQVFHPIIHQWITRVGVASVMIQQVSKNKGGTGDITNIGDKIKNTLTKDYPHLYAECLKSAAKTLGVAFGRDLNRKEVDEYNPVYTQEIQVDEIRAELEAKLNACSTTKEMVGVWNDYSDYHGNSQLRKIFTMHKSKLAYK